MAEQLKHEATLLDDAHREFAAREQQLKDELATERLHLRSALAKIRR